MAEWGHVKISRKAYARNEWWNEPRRFSKWEAWEDCIQMAAWKVRRFAIGHDVEELARGELQASIRYLADRWRWGKHMVEKFLEVAQKRGRLVRQREGQGGTVYLLANYEMYQGQGDVEGTPDGTENGTPRGHLGDNTEAVKAVEAIKALSPRATNGVQKHPKRTPPVHANWVHEAREIYAKDIGLLSHGMIGRTLKPLVDRRGWDEVKRVLECFCELSPYTDYLNRVESNTLRPGEEKVKIIGYNTELTTFVKRYTHWLSHLQVTT